MQMFHPKGMTALHSRLPLVVQHVMVEVMVADQDRFWAQVKKTSTCWLWEGPRRGDPAQPRPYGEYGFNGQIVGAHRYALVLQLGRLIRPGYEACHSCDIHFCVRHLYEGTHQDNMDDQKRKRRRKV